MITCKKVKVLTFLYFVLWGHFALFAQDNRVKIAEYPLQGQYAEFRSNVFKQSAVILKDTINEFNRYPHAAKQYIPSFTNIEAFEAILKTAPIPGKCSKSNCLHFPAYFKKFRRQYSGYITAKGDTILIVCFLDFSKKRKAAIFFKDWHSQNEFLASGLYLDSNPPPIYTYAFTLQTKVLVKFVL